MWSQLVPFLKEFKDHNLIQVTRLSAGSEITPASMISIPLQSDSLKEVVSFCSAYGSSSTMPDGEEEDEDEPDDDAEEEEEEG